MSPVVSAFVAHLLAFHIAVPEPVRVEYWPALRGFEGYKVGRTAEVFSMPDGTWLVRLDPVEFPRLAPRRQSWILAHELCHAVWDRDLPVGWEGLPEEEKRWRHERVNRCADHAMRQHFRDRTCRGR